MNCHFCFQPCEIAHLEDNLSQLLEVWKCTHCPVTVRYTIALDSKELGMICLAVPINDKRYSVQLLFPNQECRITEILHADAEVFTQRIVLELPTIPNITPSNVHQKLSTMLTFL